MKKNYLEKNLCKSFLSGSLFLLLFLVNFQKMNSQDVGISALVSPTSPLCAANNQTVTVTMNNYDAATIDFSANPVLITVNVTGASTQTFTATISTGTLAAGATQNVVVSTTANMTAVGTHTFNANTVGVGDLNGANDAMLPVNIIVNALPTVTAVATNTAICNGSSTTLTASGATNYTWSANAASATTATVSVSPTSTDTYTVTGDDGTCAATQTVMVTVNPTPVIVTNASPQNICSGASSVLTVSGATTYTWSANAGSVNTTTVSVSPTSTDTYTVTGDDGTCTSTQTVVVTVTSLPNLVVTASSTVICMGSSATIVATGATTYTWSANAGSVNTSTVSVSPTSNDTYTVTGDNSGCTATQTVAINVTPNPTLTATTASASVCAGQSVMLTASGATTYTWSANAGSATTSTVSVSPSSNDTYTVTGTVNGCSNTAMVSVSVTNGPVVTTTATPTGCAGTNGSATALGTGSGSITYTWMPGGLNTPTITGLTPGVYTVTVKDAGVCATVATVTVTSPAGALQTTYAAGNGQNGNMFNISATNLTNITSFDCNVDTTTAGAANDSIKVYYIASNYVGQSATPGAWTYLGGAHVTSAGVNAPTPIPVPINVTIPAGQTYGFYITRTTPGIVLKYTNGLTFGAVFASNSDFGILEGNGVAYPFGQLYPTSGTGSRVWNGTVHYCNAVGVEQYLSTVSSFIYPQPMVDHATIKISGLNTMGTVTLKVFDAMGKLVKENTSTNADEISVDRGNMVNGMYFYHVYNDQNKIISKGKLMVE